MKESTLKYHLHLPKSVVCNVSLPVCLALNDPSELKGRKKRGKVSIFQRSPHAAVNTAEITPSCILRQSFHFLSTPEINRKLEIKLATLKRKEEWGHSFRWPLFPSLCPCFSAISYGAITGWVSYFRSGANCGRKKASAAENKC